MYDHKYGAFTDINDKQNSADDLFNCAQCSLARAERDKEDLIHIRDRQRLLEGFSCLGEDFHYADGVLISSDSGPCLIGQIVKLPNGRVTGDFWITVRLFGRMSKRKDLDRTAGVGLYEVSPLRHELLLILDTPHFILRRIDAFSYRMYICMSAPPRSLGNATFSQSLRKCS